MSGVVIKAEFDTNQAARIVNYLKKSPYLARKAANDEITEIIISLRNRIINKMRNTPRDYTKPYPRGTKIHYPSKRGNAPAVDTGNLVGSIKTAHRDLEGELYVDGAPYVEYLEPPGHLDRPVFEDSLEEMDAGNRITRKIIESLQK